MFKESSKASQPDLFGSFDFNLDEARVEELNDESAWFNQFLQNVTLQLDEKHFEVLYSGKMGRTNASIRVLLAMMALKAGFGWSDAQLYDQVKFNLQVMRAVGFVNLNDRAPVPSTYYLFKHSVYQYHIEHGKDLIEEAFKKLTKSQLEFFDVDGSKIRMDSKLIGSNIVQCSRLQLIISCLREFWKSLEAPQRNQLQEEDRKMLIALSEKKPHRIVFSLSEKGKAQKLSELGYLLFRLQELYNDDDSDQYFLIDRLLSEQYQVDEKEVLLKEGKDISANSLQSAFDPDASYRKKGDQSVKGYSVNITETCNQEDLNLVTDVQVEAATIADKDFAQTACKNTTEVVGTLKEIYMDGAYQAEDTFDAETTEATKQYYTGIAGKKGKYEYKLTEMGLGVLNTETGELIKASEYKADHYKFLLPNGKWRYIRPKDLESYNRRMKTESLPVEIKNRRNNVEASIFQLSYHTRNNKTRYRGRFRTKMWALSRAIWMNSVRITRYLTEGGINPQAVPA